VNRGSFLEFGEVYGGELQLVVRPWRKDVAAFSIAGAGGDASGTTAKKPVLFQGRAFCYCDYFWIVEM
jgi:hypothetical protein